MHFLRSGVPFLAGIAALACVPAKQLEPEATNCGCEDMPMKISKDSPLDGAEQSDLKGAIAPVHDPSMAKEGRTYYAFCTGPGIPVRSSADRITWSEPHRSFEAPFPWTATTIPGSRDHYWAPDISYFNHKWHLYYAVSTFGRNRSAIGLATNATLDPTRKEYKWVDEGPIFQSYPKDDYNAIDPNVAFDEHGKPWLSFGSFWSGLKILPLDPATGKPLNENAPKGIASRPHTPEQPGAIEAPFIIRKGRRYYLFASFDFCCRGVRSTYNIRVGRSEKIDGPYMDRDGKDMMEGGGTHVLDGKQRWKGPGGQSVIKDGRNYVLVYHSYDAQANGVPTLRIETMTWDKDGWPHVPSDTE
ncbi:MAG TPA: arabinan endo-1,5-alpha-L-arabinosidase [Fimbriimonas sp.]|nr:arabinan endo-1,5-alpha-L-arabinosidase [Fimbriimonas sp.]